MADYFRHWIKMQRTLTRTPRIFHVNWFRKDQDGKFIWPGYSENIRMVFQREGEGEDSKITVQFPRFGLKKLVEKYAQLEAV